MLFSGYQLFNTIYNDELVLGPESASFPMWRDIPPLQVNNHFVVLIIIKLVSFFKKIKIPLTDEAFF